MNIAMISDLKRCNIKLSMYVHVLRCVNVAQIWPTSICTHSSFKVLMFMNISSLYMYVAFMEGNMKNDGIFNSKLSILR